MDQHSYQENYFFEWELIETILNGRSSLDSKHFVRGLESREKVVNYLNAYGYDIDNPVQNAELFGNFQEAIQFVKRYFLKEGNDSGLDFAVPLGFNTITDISELFTIASGFHEDFSQKHDQYWAAIILKVMHTILHTDKDLRHRYLPAIQMQIFDRFYKFIHRDEQDQLFLKAEGEELKLPLVDFQTKALKARESTIIKLLHKKENVAEELFDRIGVRFVTRNKIDCLRVMKFLTDHHVVLAHNMKPSRAVNTLIDIDNFRLKFDQLIEQSQKESWEEQKLNDEFEKVLSERDMKKIMISNPYTLEDYRAIHFTCRQLIKYRNPFMDSFVKLKKKARQEQTELAKEILELDTSTISRDLRFFYPFEVQITDQQSFAINQKGEASHEEYKAVQLASAMKRLFKPLIDLESAK